jgi:dTMP kinase
MASDLPVVRGAFIVVEGLDRSGKTTQVKRLGAELSKQGRKVKTIRFPGKFYSRCICP